MSNGRYRTLKVFDHKEWLVDCPIKIEKSQLLFDNQKELIVLQVKMFNLSQKVIRAVYLDVKCFDDAMDYVNEYNDISYQGVNAFSHTLFGDRQANYLEESNISNVKIVISKVVYENNEVWRNDKKEIGILLPEPKLLNVNDELYKQIIREFEGKDVKPKFWFEDNEDYWRCACGQANMHDSLECGQCSTKKSWLENKFDKEYLLENIKEYKEAQLLTQLQTEKKNKKRSLIIMISIVIYYILLIIFYIKGRAILQESGYNLTGFGKKVTIITFVVPIIILIIYKIVISRVIQKRTGEKIKKKIAISKNKKVVIICFGIFIASIMIYIGNEIYYDNKSLNELVQKGNIRRIEKFLEEGNDVDEADENGITALNLAIKNGNEKIVKCLVDNGADVNYIDSDERSILQNAKQQGNNIITDFLIKNGAKETGDYIDVISGLAIEKIKINDKVYDGYKFCEFTTKNITKKNINYIKYEIIFYKNGVKMDNREYVWDLVVEPGESNTMTTCNTLPYTVDYDDVKIKVVKVN